MRLPAIAAVLAGLALPALAQNTPDAAEGEKLFQASCALCHSATAERGPRSGPPLWGVFGRRAGFVKGFPYSEAHLKSGLVWNAPTLEKYLADPRATIPGTAKIFRGTATAEDRAALIAYLQTLK